MTLKTWRETNASLYQEVLEVERELDLALSESVGSKEHVNIVLGVYKRLRVLVRTHPGFETSSDFVRVYHRILEEGFGIK